MADQEQLAVPEPRDGGVMPDGVAIYVLVDALGWEILKGRPFLDGLVERYRVQTILGYSSGAIPTLLTGQYPEAHGHWNLFYRSPRTSPFRWTTPLTMLPRPVREHRVTRRVVKEISRRISGYSGYFAIYNLPIDRLRFYDICETTDIYQPGGLAPARSLFDILREREIGYDCFTYHRYTDAQILDLAARRMGETDTRVYFLYLAELDSYLHFHVSDATGVAAKLAWYDEGLRRVHAAAAARWGRVRLYVFSDHGMTPITGTRDVIAAVERAGLRVPDDILPAYDSTMARFWINSDGAEDRLRACLGALPYGRTLAEAELKSLGIHFPDGRYGHVVFLMDPGLLICPSDMGRIRFDGMHGFHPEADPASYAVLLSSERLSRSVAHVTDVLPLLRQDLGLEGGSL